MKIAALSSPWVSGAAISTPIPTIAPRMASDLRFDMPDASQERWLPYSETASTPAIIIPMPQPNLISPLALGV